MTTIVCSRSEMAADSMASDGDTKAEITKIRAVRGGYVGIAGDVALANHFMEWLKAGAKEDPGFDLKKVGALYLTKDGKILCYDGYYVPYEVHGDFAAIGGGAQAALAAMHMGATPKRAVEIAALVHPGTGGKIVNKRLRGR